MKVLVVEDDLDMRECLKDTLVDFGYSVDVAANGAEGVVKVMEGNYGAMVLDLAMPGMDGTQVLKILKDAGRLLPTVIMSGYAPRDVGVKVRWMLKPFDIDDLHALIQHSVGQPQEDRASL